MKENVIICRTCLSNNRALLPASKILTILKEIKLDELIKMNYGICWECNSIIMKYHKFRKQVQEAEKMLSAHKKHRKSLSNLTKITKCNYDIEYTYNDPLISNEIEKKQPKIKLEVSKNTDDIFTSNHNGKWQDELKTEDFQDNDTNKTDYHHLESDDDDKSLHIFADSLKCNRNKRFLKNKLPLVKKIKDETGLKEKFETLLYTENEMLRSREEKRSQHNFKKVPYKCNTCVLGFMKKENYDVHLEKKHAEKIGPHICDVCATRFTSQNHLKSHRNRHYIQYKCLLCDYKTTGRKPVINHCREKHANDTKDNIHCKQCDVVVRTAQELAEHSRKEHSSSCPDCGEKFKDLKNLKTHQVRIHRAKREFTCDICTRSFRTKSRLESHMIKHCHRLAKTMCYCEQCDVQYKNISVYRNHMRNTVNHSQDRYPCPDCNRMFASKGTMTKHYNFYHLNKSKFKCEPCNKLFISDYRLKNHKYKHHGLSRNRNHACDVCGKHFYSLPILRNHQLTHSEHRSYMCEDCGDTFKQRPALYNHARLVHKGYKK